MPRAQLPHPLRMLNAATAVVECENLAPALPALRPRWRPELVRPWHCRAEPADTSLGIASFVRTNRALPKDKHRRGHDTVNTCSAGAASMTRTEAEEPA